MCSRAFGIVKRFGFGLEARLCLNDRETIPGLEMDTSTGRCQSLSIPCIPSSTRALVFFSAVLGLCCLQVLWPSSETDINCRDQSGLAFEEVFTFCSVSPLRCPVPFKFLLHLSLQRAKGGSSHDWSY